MVPSFRGVPEQIAREAREKWADAASDGFDERMEKRAAETGKKMGAQISKELGKAGKDAGDKAGESYSGAFRAAMTKGLASAQRELNTTPLKLVLHDEDLRKKMDKIRADFKSLDRQVKLGTDAGGSFIELQRLLGVIEDVQDKAKNIEVRANLAQIHRELSGVAAHMQQLSAMDIEPELKIERQLSLFERRLKAGIQSALNDLPPVELDDSVANGQIRALREKLLGLDRDIEVGVDSAQAFAELAAIESAAERLADDGMSMDLRVNAAGVFKTTAAVRAELESLSRITIEPELELDRQLGAFERGFKGAVENALRDLGTVDTSATAGLDENAGQRAVRDLREQLFGLNDLRIGVDISAETARERLTQIREQLEQLQREHWDVRLDADTAAAAGQLGGFLAALEAIDHETYTADLEVKGVASAIAQAKAADAALGHTSETIKRLSSSSNDGANSFRAFNTRVLGVAALGPLVVPALGAIAGGIAALLPLAAAGAAGLGVLGLALMGVGDAFKAMGDVRTKAAADTRDYERGLRTAARGVEDAQRGVTRAQEGAARSSESSAGSIVAAEQSVADARRDAAQAAEQAARQVEQANRGVKQAEQTLAGAQRTAQQAQEELTKAREDAVETMEDLRLSVEGGALAERDAVLDLRDAQRDLAAARADGASGDELERYILKVDQADLALRRAKESNSDLAKESAEWAQTGVEGSDQVVAAQDRVAAAQRGIADAEDSLRQAQQGLTDARMQQARTAEDSQRRVADAEKGLADARRDQARQAVDSQQAIADAQRGLADAQLAYDDALNKTSSSQDKLRDSMAKLGPAGQEFVKFLDGLRPKFDTLRSISQEGVLPGLTDWIDSLVTGQGPRLMAVVSNISRAVGQMFSAFGQSIRGPAFSDLFDMLATSGPTFIRQMGEMLTNIVEGVARMAVAMEPLGRLFGEGLVNATRRFNEWAASLRGSRGLQDFFGWIERVGPKVANFFWELGDALIQIGIAIAPFAEGMVDKLTGFFDWISNINPSVLGPIVVSILALTVALQAIFGLTALAHQFKTAINLTKDSLVGLGGATKFLGWAAILAAALYLLYQNSEQFQGVVDHLWKDVLEPFGGFLKDSFGPLFEWLAGLLSDNIELVATIAAAWASWKIITQVVLWIETLRTALAGLAVAQALVGGSAAAGGIMTGITSRAGMGATAGGGLLAGGALAAGGAALGVGAGIYASRMSTKNDQEDWAQALRRGGAAAANAREDMSETNLWDRFKFNMGHWGNTENVSARQTREVTEALREQFEAMSPLEQAQTKVAEWTETLSYRQKSGTATSEELTAAHQRLEYWTGMLDKAQGTNVTTTEALTRANGELLDGRNAQVSATIALADAEIAYTQSKAALNDAHAEYVRISQDANATDEERRRAEEAWTNQSRQTAEAAKQVAQARLANMDAATQEAHGNAALLLDLERQKEAYGSLPPRLEELRASLAATVDPAVLTAEKFNNLGLEIKDVPDLKTIVVSSETSDAQLQKMRDLGFSIEQLPNGEYEVTALTAEAEGAIEELTKPRTIQITAAMQGMTDARQNQTGAYGPVGGSAGRNAQGGHITGPGTGTSDSILSWLSNGEYVVKAASVAKYGVGLLDAINRGEFSGDAPAYRTGGPVRRQFKRGRPAFEDGGYVANYGGTISLSGMAVPELAGWWVGALSSINSAASQAALHISRAFSGLRDALLGNFRDVHTESSSIWSDLFSVLTGKATDGAGLLSGIFGGIRDDVKIKTLDTHTGVTSTWQAMRDSVLGRADETRDGTNTRMGQLRDGASATIGDAVARMLLHWGGLPAGLTDPVNTIIDKVLNNGLFKAFNSIVGALGLDVKLNIPTAEPVRIKTMLATGGQVPGYSPHAKADNIPAMLTAGEWVQPVDSVNYYGHDFMEAIRKRRIPREALGIQPLHRAEGGLIALGRRLQAMGAKVTEHPAFGGVAMGGHGKTSLHYTGHALDVNTRPGTSALEQAELAPMEKLARSLGFRTIFMAPDHYNHLHVDDGGGKSILGGLVDGALDFFSNPLGTLQKAFDDALGTDFEGGAPVRQVMASGARKFIGLMADKVTGWMGNFFDDGTESLKSRALGGNAAANEKIVQSLAAARGWTGSEWSALRGLIMKGSGFNNLAQNPTSSAYGMFQFLNGTWGPYGAKTADPTKQAQYGLSYIGGRYGSPSRALAFHNAHNWYSEGGPVQERDSATGAIIPDLHDMGGMVMPGLNVLMNRTGKPEAVINPQTIDALTSIAATGRGGAPMVGAYHQTVVSNSPHEAMDELLHTLDAIDLGGRYGD